MENEDTGSVREETVKIEDRKKNPIIPILAILLGANIIFSALQTVYIISLSSGKRGNMTYEDNDRKSTASQEDEEKETNSNMAAADPAFSLEEAASVHDPDKETLSTMDIVDLVSPATVSVYIMSGSEGSESRVASGSGFIITDNGYVVTNEHVVSYAVSSEDYRLKISVPGYDELIPAKIVGVDEQTDVAVLQLMEEHVYEHVTLGDSTVLRRGELAVLIGNPTGNLEGTVNVGVISAIGREINNKGYTMTLIQTDASINSGNSGGPLLNSFGEVIGIANAKIGTAESLGFAIPISEVKDEIESIIQNGYVANRPYLGITVAKVEENSYYGATEGVYVAEITEGGPGDKAGLKVGDRFITMDGQEVKDTSDILAIRDAHEVGDTVEVTVDRDGNKVTLDLTIGDGVNS